MESLLCIKNREAFKFFHKGLKWKMEWKQKWNIEHRYDSISDCDTKNSLFHPFSLNWFIRFNMRQWKMMMRWRFLILLLKTMWKVFLRNSQEDIPMLHKSFFICFLLPRASAERNKNNSRSSSSSYSWSRSNNKSNGSSRRMKKFPHIVIN